ncbi:TPA: hypothetical protein HA249_02100 [Candidatus Woesearchaeota archaeon]|nr:hypothetical protein [Candidatus Woesearchaeota archaeon]HII88310.1 hypothetical protein [Candidatus Woesearchaeota archaeon]
MYKQKNQDIIKKNLLDLDHTTYLQYTNTTTVIMFTYLVGLLVAWLTNQISFSEPKHALKIVALTIVFFFITHGLLVHFYRKIKNIKEEIKNLDL